MSRRASRIGLEAWERSNLEAVVDIESLHSCAAERSDKNGIPLFNSSGSDTLTTHYSLSRLMRLVRDLELGIERIGKPFGFQHLSSFFCSCVAQSKLGQEMARIFLRI